MPVTAALVVAVALVPLLEWFERRGVPSRFVRGPLRDHIPRRCDLRNRLDRRSCDRLDCPRPHRIGKVRAAPQPILELYQNLYRFITRTAAQIQVSQEHARTVRIEDFNVQ